MLTVVRRSLAASSSLLSANLALVVSELAFGDAVELCRAFFAGFWRVVCDGAVAGHREALDEIPTQCEHGRVLVSVIGPVYLSSVFVLSCVVDGDVFRRQWLAVEVAEL